MRALGLRPAVAVAEAGGQLGEDQAVVAGLADRRQDPAAELDPAVVLLIRLDLEHGRRRQHEVGVRDVRGREPVDRRRAGRARRGPRRQRRRVGPRGEHRRAAHDHAANRVRVAVEDGAAAGARRGLPGGPRGTAGTPREPMAGRADAGAGVVRRRSWTRSRGRNSFPPGLSRWPARAWRDRTARIACTPLFEYSSPVYMRMERPRAAAIVTREIADRLVGRTPVIACDAVGRERAGVRRARSSKPWVHRSTKLAIVGAGLDQHVGSCRAPGRRRCRAGCRPTRQRSARAVSERRWSITTTRPPRACAALRRTRFSGGEAVAGLAPHTRTRSAASRSSCRSR